MEAMIQKTVAKVRIICQWDDHVNADEVERRVVAARLEYVNVPKMTVEELARVLNSSVNFAQTLRAAAEEEIGSIRDMGRGSTCTTCGRVYAFECELIRHNLLAHNLEKCVVKKEIEEVEGEDYPRLENAVTSPPPPPGRSTARVIQSKSSMNGTAAKGITLSGETTVASRRESEVKRGPADSAKKKSRLDGPPYSCGVPYSDAEDRSLLDYIVRNKRGGDTSTRVLWKEMAEEGVIPGRSKHSMRERFRRIIADPARCAAIQPIQPGVVSEEQLSELRRNGSTGMPPVASAAAARDTASGGSTLQEDHSQQAEGRTPRTFRTFEDPKIAEGRTGAGVRATDNNGKLRGGGGAGLRLHCEL